MKKYLALGFLGLMLGLAAYVYAHETGARVTWPFMDGTTKKAAVVYYGDQSSGSQLFAVFSYGADYMAWGTQNNADVVGYTNNVLRSRLANDGVDTLYSGASAIKREVRAKEYTLTDNVASNVVALGTTSDTAAGVRITYSTVVYASGEQQFYSGAVSCRAINDGGAVTASCTDVADGASPYVSSGTGTPVWAIGSDATGQVTVTLNTSLTATSMKLYAVSIQNMSGLDITVN